MCNLLSKTVGMAIAALLLIATACTNNRGTVERPFITAANTKSLSFEKIELSDSATVLYGVIHFRPNYWVRIASSSFIKADGKNYVLTGTDGMPLDKEVWMPDSGVIHFTLTFPPIPSDVESIDFSEGTDDGWQLWGIDLTGKSGHDINLSDIPAEARKPMADGPLPEPGFAFDTTTVNIHLVGYRPGMIEKIGYAINTVHGQTGSDTPLPVDSLGNARIRIALSAPARIFLFNPSQEPTITGSAILMPGETVDLYSDTHTSGKINMSVRDGSEDPFAGSYLPYYSTGTCGNIDMLTGRNRYAMQLYSGEFADYRMNGEQYTDYIIDQYKALKDSVDAGDCGEMAKEYGTLNLQAQLIYATADFRNILERNYYNKYDNWGDKIPADSINISLSPENIRRIAECLDLDNPKLVMAENAADLGYTRGIWKNAGIDPGITEALYHYNNAYAFADKAELTDDMLTELRKTHPAMADEAVAHNKARKAILESLDLSMITPTPEVAPAKILDAIIAPHKGKVVMVDLWNTWCGPCRAAIAHNEPAKNGELSSDDIVWIYIADESSPMPKYISMIKEIRGIHYRLNEEQITKLRERFDVDGIPYYILVDRAGKAAGRPDLRDHSAFKKALLDEVAK